MAVRALPGGGTRAGVRAARSSAARSRPSAASLRRSQNLCPNLKTALGRSNRTVSAAPAKTLKDLGKAGPHAAGLLPTHGAGQTKRAGFGTRQWADGGTARRPVSPGSFWDGRFWDGRKRIRFAGPAGH